MREHREAYKPFEYPEFQEIFERASMSPWTKKEAMMETDYRDWMMSSPVEKEVIGGILNGFIQGEVHVSDHWERICEWFPKHEIVNMCRLFAYNERIHADAYAHLQSTLGIEDYDAFLREPEVGKKLSIFLEDYDILTSLGVFSGGIEGVSLFGSFAVLLSFSRNARFRGLRQIISWSILDEQMHSDAAALLFRRYGEEIGGVPEETEDAVIEGFHLALENEEACLRKVFSGRDLEGLALEDLLHFLRLRANERLMNMGLFPVFELDPEAAQRIKEWFDPLAAGNVNQDFFASTKEGSGYVARPDQQFDTSLLKELDLSYA